jgi:hypothetical protein
MVALGSTLIDTAKFGSNDVTSFYLGSNEAWTAGEPAELIKPTSIANSGGSATLGTNGQVTFSGVTSVSLNGVFSADFDNYIISLRSQLSSSNRQTRLKLRSSGTDTTGSDYVYQQLEAYNTTVNAALLTGEPSARLVDTNSTYPGGQSVFIYGPALAQPTAFRTVGMDANGSASIQERASTHSLSTAYDGCTLFIGEVGYTGTGALQVYGLRA